VAQSGTECRQRLRHSHLLCPHRGQLDGLRGAPLRRLGRQRSQRVRLRVQLGELGVDLRLERRPVRGERRLSLGLVQERLLLNFRERGLLLLPDLLELLVRLGPDLLDLAPRP